MSATADSTIAAPRSGRIDPKYTRDRTKSGNFEMLTWLFMRLSGIVLVVLIFVHLFSNLMVGDGINGLDFGFVAGKWADPFWQFWDLALLWLAMLHGTNGVRTIINDYAERDGVRFWLKMVLYAATTVIIVLGTLVIFTFEPCLTDAAGNLLEASPAFCATP
ncbi:MULTISPECIES: succinate dehydrogenase hydrophobic membrane anchor subunit [Citricoccus]|uniref:succinate dehydrogenase hydrophobic membrane anchor subunit n=1 Tax=Citricoccus TaxID=169133 RepID=UPI000255F362|nr:succinate dehydrogenase hydrophobic membrane anchor subunit [Citricoccus sp. CH26A]